ncbi:acyl-CoA N-acyltransferase [Scenedesmus sp. NREL 46B-D3]|nr:acyl-CoA N-acyltransferase [Scenedesmus sp. NREL 46B-D3]
MANAAAAAVAASSEAESRSNNEASTSSCGDGSITFRQYKDECDLPIVMDLIDRSLSEPYSVFTYRYFLHQWPHLCYLAFDGSKAIGVIVAKMDDHRGHLRGYIAMLVVDSTYRGKGLGRALAKMAISEMVRGECEEVVLEAEVSNTGALTLYRSLGFIRDKQLHRYYLNNQDAYRLKLLLPLTAAQQKQLQQQRADEQELLQLAAAQQPQIA